MGEAAGLCVEKRHYTGYPAGIWRDFPLLNLQEENKKIKKKNST